MKQYLQSRLPGCRIESREDLGVLCCKWERICSAVVTGGHDLPYVDISHWEVDESILEPVAIEACPSLEDGCRRMVDVTVAFWQVRRELDSDLPFALPLAFGTYQLDNMVFRHERLPNLIDLCQLPIRALIALCGRAVLRAIRFQHEEGRMDIDEAVRCAFEFAAGASHVATTAEMIWRKLAIDDKPDNPREGNASIDPVENSAAGLCQAIQWASDFVGHPSRLSLYHLVKNCTGDLRSATDTRQWVRKRGLSPLVSAIACDFVRIHTLCVGGRGEIGLTWDASDNGPLGEVAVGA
jgi:hypothetical protein